MTPPATTGEISPQHGKHVPAWFTPYHVAELFREYSSPDCAEDDLVFEAVKARFATLEDDDAIAWLARAYTAIEAATYGLKWAAKIAESDLERRLRERMAARGNDAAEIAIPHPLVDVVLAPQFGPYEPDVDTLEKIAGDPALSDAERSKLVKILPERIEPERTVVVPETVIPRQVLPGNSTSIMSIAKKYAGSALARAIVLAMPRRRLDDKFVIRRKKA